MEIIGGSPAGRLSALDDRIAGRDRLLVRRAELVQQLNGELLRIRSLELRGQSLDAALAGLNRGGLVAALQRLLSGRRREAIMAAERQRQEVNVESEKTHTSCLDTQRRLREAADALAGLNDDCRRYSELAAERIGQLDADDPQRGARLRSAREELARTTSDLGHLDDAHVAGAEVIAALKELVRSLASTGEDLIDIRGRGLVHVLGQLVSAAHNGLVHRRNADPIQKTAELLDEFDAHVRALPWDPNRPDEVGVCALIAELRASRTRLYGFAREVAGRPELVADSAHHVQAIMNQLDVKRLELTRRARDQGAEYRRLLAAEPRVAQSGA